MAGSRKGSFQFTSLELAALAASFFITSLLVFILGFYVGREVASQHDAPGPQVARVPVPAGSENGDPVRDESKAEFQRQKPAVTEDGGEAVEGKAGEAPVLYTVQVQATRSRREAEALVAQLGERGLGAFVTPAGDADSRWFRVRVGRFKEIEAARAMAAKCRDELGLEQAYVGRY